MVMSVTQIIHKIDEVIRDAHTTRDKKIASLQHLALICWQEVIPEYSNPDKFIQLDQDEIHKRWMNIRDDIGKYKTKEKILYVLDWPASGGDFYWVQ